MAEKDYTVPALQKGLKILEMFDYQRHRLTQAEMADTLGVSSASLYRIVQTLATMGYLKKVGKNTYELGFQVVSRGFSYLAGKDVVEICTPYINRLRDRTSLSSHLAIREGHEAVYVFRALARQRLSVNVPIGTRFPCHITAIGRALMAGMSAAEIEAIYQGKRLDGYPDSALQTLPDLQALCEKESAQGWHLHHSHHATAIAVPIRNHTGEVVAAINVSIPDPIFTSDGVRDRSIKALKEIADDIMKELGRL